MVREGREALGRRSRHCSGGGGSWSWDGEEHRDLGEEGAAGGNSQLYVGGDMGGAHRRRHEGGDDGTSRETLK